MGNGKQHDQHELLTLLLDRLLREQVIPESVLHSYKCSIIKCSECGYQAEYDASATPVLLTRVSENVQEEEMDSLVAKALAGPDAVCPDCHKRGKEIPMYRSTDPLRIEYPELLLVTVGRYNVCYILCIILEHLIFRYATKGRKVYTQIKRAEKINYGKEVYSLVGFTSHEGNSTARGHYLGYNAETSEQFDDNGGITLPEVYDLNLEELESAKEEGYIYLYKRVTNR